MYQVTSGKIMADLVMVIRHFKAALYGSKGSRGA